MTPPAAARGGVGCRREPRGDGGEHSGVAWRGHTGARCEGIVSELIAAGKTLDLGLSHC
jgi:hypothetical protein